MQYVRICKDDKEHFGESFRDMPDVPDEELLEVRENFVNYIFYRRERKAVHGRCSCCGKEMIATRDHEACGDLLGDLWQAKDKETGECPFCGQEVVYRAVGRFKDFSALESYDNVIFILPTQDGQTVFFRCYTVFANYHADGPVKLCFVEKAHYRLSPGEWMMERRSFVIYEPLLFDTLACYNGIYDEEYIGPWEERKRPCDPWQPFMYYSPSYTFMNMQRLRETFLRYSRVDDFNRVVPLRGRGYTASAWGSTKLMAYLCYYAQYPSLEIAMRTGGDEAARELIYAHRKNTAFINWRAQNPLEFWRISKEEYRATEGADRFSFFRECRQYFGRLPIGDLVLLHKEGELQARTFFEIMDILENERPSRVLKYCHAHNKQYIIYKDYLEAAREIGRDLTVHNVCYPKNLRAAHDEAVAARNYMKNEKKYAAWEKKAREYAKSDAKRRRFYDFAEGDFFVRVAKDGPEIVAEGNALCHCVGGYVERHVTCKTTILFIRKRDEPNEPFYTVEMREGKLQQVHGFRNCAISGAAKDFFDHWLLWLQAGGGIKEKKKAQECAERQVG